MGIEWRVEKGEMNASNVGSVLAALSFVCVAVWFGQCLVVPLVRGFVLNITWGGRGDVRRRR